MRSKWCCIGITCSVTWNAVLKLAKGAGLPICEKMSQMYLKEEKRKEKPPAPRAVGAVRTADDVAELLLLKEGLLEVRAALLAEEVEEKHEPPPPLLCHCCSCCRRCQTIATW
jgi:hypothetical protein